MGVGDPFGVLTGLMPSGRMHLGHSMVIEQVRWFQEQGADVTVAVADLEAMATRGTSIAEGRDTALREYVLNYAALGLDPDNTNVYFQSSRPAVHGSPLLWKPPISQSWRQSTGSTVKQIWHTSKHR